jgi:hypothetical protein
MYIGVHVHKEFVQACAMDEQGRVVKEGEDIRETIDAALDRLS